MISNLEFFAQAIKCESKIKIFLDIQSLKNVPLLIKVLENVATTTRAKARKRETWNPRN